MNCDVTFVFNQEKEYIVRLNPMPVWIYPNYRYISIPLIQPSRIALSNTYT